MTDHRPSMFHTTALRAVARGVCLSLLIGALTPALAQFRRDAPAVNPRIQAGAGLSTELSLAGKPTTADYILAVVNNEVVTHTDVDKRVARLQATAQRGVQLPPPDELRRQVLDALIDEKAQLGLARTLGIDVADTEIDATIESIAMQNQMTRAELKRRMEADGLDFQRYRASLREQLLLQRVREREVGARIRVSDDEITAFLESEPASQAETALNLAHILIAVPEGAKAEQVNALKAKAEALREQVARGGNFSELARTQSDDRGTREQGGAFGLREASRLPELFVQSVQGLQIGQVAPVVRSNAGFHVIKLVGRENTAQASYTEQRARHILLRSNPQQPAGELVKRLADIRRQIATGQGSFPQMARQYSEDGSAARGGDLGWAPPGMFVPEFERALNALQPGQISEPVVTRFGVHLIQLIERREVQLSDAQKREAARNVLRERKFESTYEEWAREIRAAAWVEMRDAP